MSPSAEFEVAHRSPLHPMASRLGYLGLLPFVFGALLAWLVDGRAHPHVMLGLSAYAGVILSFLGGVHWGLAMRGQSAQASPYLWGVVPSLVGFIAVVMPAYAGLVIHGVMLVVCYLVDRRFYPRHGAAAWLTLRFRLSLVAALSCFVAAAST